MKTELETELEMAQIIDTLLRCSFVDRNVGQSEEWSTEEILDGGTDGPPRRTVSFASCSLTKLCWWGTTGTTA